MNGFIYILSNPTFSTGLLKIGKSKSDPGSSRIDELYTTGVPGPFKVEYSAFVEDFDEVELRVHKKLSAYRPNNNREFFDCLIPQAILTIQEIADIKYEENFYKSPEEIEEEIIRQKAEQAKQKRLQKLEEDKKIPKSQGKIRKGKFKGKEKNL